MMVSLSFDTLAHLAGSKSVADVPCPLCGPNCTTKANQLKRVLRIWRQAYDFSTFYCVRCGAKDWAAPHCAKFVTRRELVVRMRKADAHQAANEAERRRKARWLLSESEPISGTPAETYLRSRDITVDPSTLRFLPPRGKHGPAMLAAFGLPGEPEPGHYELKYAAVYAVHITRLKPDGRGKAPDAEGRSKIMLGVPKAWPIALVPPNDAGGIAIAEGIEDALSLHCATGLGAWVREPQFGCRSLRPSLRVFLTWIA